MERTDERRLEKRLHYRWPVRFAGNPRQKPLAGQMFDLSSTGMSMLFHANKDCPKADQFITANFGVPHFDAHGSFDTAFFNRVGRVCRVDHLTSRVNRIAIQFAEPLFFKPGEQNISESDAQERLCAKIKSVVNSNKQKAASAETLTRAKEKAQDEAKSQSRLRKEAERRALTEAEKRAAAEARALESARLFEKEIAKVRANAAREIARLEDEAEYKIAEAKAEVRTKLLAQAKAREKEQKRQKKKNSKSAKISLVQKLDEFITDRGQMY